MHSWKYVFQVFRWDDQDDSLSISLGFISGFIYITHSPEIIWNVSFFKILGKKEST